jgi:hypothetical protein
MIGLVLPYLGVLPELRNLLGPVIDWIPNISALARLTDDPIFTEVFLASSLILAFGIGFPLLIFFSGRFQAMTHPSVGEKILRIAVLFLFSAGMIGVCWFFPYPEREYIGRAQAVLRLASSSGLGVLTIMNLLMVGFPLTLLMINWSMIFCTNVLRPTSR